MSKVHVAAAIIQRAGSVFAAHRTASQCGPGWEFPGGRVEEDETSEQAVRREIAEELGARLSTTWLLDTVSNDYPTFELEMDCFVCELAEGESLTLSEHDEGRWVGRDELLGLEWLPADRKVARILGMFWDQIFAAQHL